MTSYRSHSARRLSTSVVLWLLATSFAPAAFSRQSEFIAGPTDPRFVPERGVLVPVDPSGSSPLRVGVRGTLMTDVEFTSDLVDANGDYSIRPARVVWRIRDSFGRDIRVRGATGADQAWNGTESPVEVMVTGFDRATGVCSAVVEIPVGGHIQSLFGVLGRYPMLPDGGAVVEFAIGWDRRLHVEADGTVGDVLAQGSLAFDTEWPDVWIGNESPRGPAQVGDAGFEILVTLKEPASSDRTLEIRARPDGVVEVLTPTLVVPAGEDMITVAIRGERTGDYRLEVLENGAVVARSAVESVVRPQIFGSESEPALWMTSEGLADPGTPGNIWDDKYCVEGYQVGSGGNQPVYEFCYKCKQAPNPQPSCPGEAGGTWALWVDAYCVDGDDSCELAITPVGNIAYVYSSKRETICQTAAYDISAKPFGVGTSTTWTKTFTAWCCKYEYSGTGPGNVPGVSRAVCGNL